MSTPVDVAMLVSFIASLPAPGPLSYGLLSSVLAFRQMNSHHQEKYYELEPNVSSGQTGREA
jgi:hypothetical protein